jgi:hypothetical protein
VQVLGVDQPHLELVFEQVVGRFPLRGRRGLLVAGGEEELHLPHLEGFAAPGYAVRGRQGGHDAQAQHDQQEPGKTQTLGEAMIASTTSQALSAGDSGVAHPLHRG